ncbi:MULTISPECIES: MAPEG family protein [Phaeobacter]|uniref:Membrane protein n=1 Tax=Phaeobacter inhibens TaxID=221822 RepID=A0A2I7M1T9_9RHOB|nr:MULTISPECIES: MAPEG family protein [Phaeobacter]AUQ51257.1 putative membrane protein [Phaeobacter inhibens]AUQ95776.1 putative membrane protein [Phaeobacter inhibens]AUQ97752.1 putative membrane protein [Phaeobacter inhibens]AUR21062.1 putative membrane protein [Phaeobacter inhibens]MBQ4808397.1 MAPEG family protein [Phaeobacter sp. HS012]
MTPELTALTLAALLQALQFCAYAITANRQLDPKIALGPRDTPVTLTGTAGRFKRAMENHFEGLILFTIACGVVVISDQSTGFTAGCAWVYLCARLLYVPAYALGWTPGRSIIWFVGFFATVFMLTAALV